MAGMHDIKPVPPISPDSRLLKERNIGVKMGVRPDIKLKAMKETESIMSKTKNASQTLKKQICESYNNSVKENEAERQRQITQWVKKTKNSPYRLDQNEVDVLALQRGRERAKRQKYFKDRKETVRKMTGEPNMDFYTDRLKKSLTTEQLLAMEHLKLLKTLNTLKSEQNKLTDLVHKDCEITEKKFAAIALRRSAQRMMERSGIQSAPSSWDAFGISKTPSRAGTWKKIDNTVYSADGRWNESGQFVVAQSEKDKVGLMSAKYARMTGDAAPEVMSRRRKTEIYKMQMST
mmetsp:Transcript_12985/g.19567  ORF Transcript_12985/g.19567 Transcript_12985/m.19567 type:complete len:291 (-) Transcript_12985:89-961(-)|eukprot:CAMPEP_0185028622 /NCGR_PEP_ID=MMETSP1103-20130426/14443_1 /TAXON_ID=36769 /ORGANISM="Paraphysomonas bandaiensis, Strain Caron Lab Isolate" /LENGTH=290 /DNA_ID=CAMNT_0027563093 /DNA_START=133 /DNA_END=1005 /DNA_ORIENTATION=-